MKWCLLLLAGCLVGEDEAPFDDDPGFAPAAATTIAGFGVRADFDDASKAAAGDDKPILNRLEQMIAAAQPGDTIRAAVHSLTLKSVGTALETAAGSGVHVLIAQDGDEQFGDDAVAQHLHAVLNATPGSGHVWCGSSQPGTDHDHGCITTDGSGIMHSKLFLFSRGEVAWVGSANLTKATGIDKFNNAITVTGDHALYAGLVDYFADLYAQHRAKDYYDAPSKRGFIDAPSARVYASPEQDSDLWNARLNDIDGDASCRIRVGQNMIHDAPGGGVSPQIALLLERKAAGCKLWVVAHEIGPATTDALRAAHVGFRTDLPLHDKYVIVDAKYAGSKANRYLVFTGSHNWTDSANGKNDELLIRLESQQLYNQFWHHFADAY